MAQTPHADPGLVCPFHRKDMSEVCHKCPLWVHLRCFDHNQGCEVDAYGCSFAWLPKMLHETAFQARGAAAATEQARNSIVEQTNVLLGIRAETQKRLAQDGD